MKTALTNRRALLLCTFAAALVAGLRAEDALPFGVVAKYFVKDDNNEPHRSPNVAFSADGTMLAACSAIESWRAGGVTRVWNLTSGAAIRQFAREFHACSPDMTQFFCPFIDHAHDAEILNARMDPPESVPNTILKGYMQSAYSPDGNWLAAGDMKHQVYIWNAKTMTLSSTVLIQGDNAGNVFGQFAYSPDNQTLAACCGIDFALINLATGTARYESHDFDTNFMGSGMAFSGDGKTLACSGWAYKNPHVHGWDATTPPRIMLWDVAAKKERASYLTDYETQQLEYVGDSLALVYLGSKFDSDIEVMRICDAETGAKIAGWTIPNAKQAKYALSPDGRYLATGNTNSEVLIWDIGRIILKAETIPTEFKASDLDACWQALGGKDGAAAFRTAWKLSKSGEAGVRYIQSHIHLATKAQARVDKLIENLDSDNPGVRAAARNELVDMSDLVAADLRKVADGPARPHAQSEARAILIIIEVETAARAAQTPEDLQHARAIFALQLAGSAEAHSLLENLAANAASAFDRLHARHALRIPVTTVHAPLTVDAPAAAGQPAAAPPPEQDGRAGAAAAAIAAQGAQMAVNGQLELARKLLLHALDLDEHCALALYELGKLYQNEGDPRAGEILSRAAAAFAQDSSPDSAAKMADAKARAAKLNPYAAQLTALNEAYAGELSKLAQKFKDIISTSQLVERVTALNLTQTVAGAKLPTALPQPPPPPPPADWSKGNAAAPAADNIPPEVEKALKAAGWTTIKGQWKQVIDNVYEVTDGQLESTKVNGSVQVWGCKGSAELKVFVRNAQPAFSWLYFGKYRNSNFERGFGVIVNDLQCRVYTPLTANVGGWPGTDAYAYNDHTVTLPDAPKHLYTVNVQDSTVEIQIDGKTDRKMSFKITKDGPFTIAIKGTLRIEEPRASGQ